MKNYIYILITALALISSTLVAQEKNVFDTARFGTVPEMEQLMKADANSINSVDENGFTPLILAAYRNNESIVSFLAPKVNTIDHNCKSGTALTAASYKGLTSVVNILLENKANPNVADANGTTALIYATLSKNVEIISLLLKHGANKEHKDSRGNSALEYALISNNEKLINLLK